MTTSRPHTPYRLAERGITTKLPQPIAAAWERVRAAANEAERLRRAEACAEIVGRTLTALLLPDYLRGSRSPAVERRLDELDRPSDGLWVDLLLALATHIRDRADLPPFMPEAGYWLLLDTEASGPARALRELTMLRNRDVHGGAPATEKTAQARARDIAEPLRSVLGGLGWLANYRPVRVIAEKTTRRGGREGKLRTLVGTAADGDVINAEWTAQLILDATYLANRSGDAFLEISPFVEFIPPTEGGDWPLVHLFKSVTRSGKTLRVAHENSGSIREVPLVSHVDGSRMTWEGWRASGDRGEACLPNIDLAGSLAVEPLPPALAAGDLIRPGLTVLAILGHGGTAIVYAAWDALRKEEVAVKILNAEHMEDATACARFRREADILKRLAHERVISVRELAGMADGRLALVMGLCAGGALSDRVQTGGLPEDVIVRWARQALEGLSALHDDGVIHRDIKPSNLLLDADDDLVIGDLGIAHDARNVRITRTLDRLGSRAYCAPEQQRGLGVTDKSDIFSLAVVLHELLAGTPPPGAPGAGLTCTTAEFVRWLGHSEPDERPSALEALRRLNEAPSSHSDGEIGGADMTNCSSPAPVAPTAVGIELSRAAVAGAPAEDRLVVGLVPESAEWLAAELGVAVTAIGQQLADRGLVGLDPTQPLHSSWVERIRENRVRDLVYRRARLGEILHAAGMLSREDVEAGVAEQAKRGGKIGSTWIELGLAKQSDVLTMLASQQHAIPLPADFVRQINKETLALLPAKIAARLRAVPLARSQRRLAVAMCNPSDLVALDELKFVTSCVIEPCIATERNILLLLEQHYEIKRTPPRR